MKRALFFLLTTTIFCKAQNNLPQDYFSFPLEITPVLAGTFAELRSNHFHSGLDIKTQQREGLKVNASANGFVSRIKVSHYGYGKALYIEHPNGYTTVYAHLQKFSPEIEAYVKKRQYAAESFEIELFPRAEELPVNKNELIAYSGNTGGSAGPHLHFEIRDQNQHPMNPMLFGIDAKDTTKPHIKSIYAYALNDSSFVNNSNSRQQIRLIPLQNGDYTTESIQAIGDIGFGIEANDRQDYAPNSNGVDNIQTFFNGTQNFEIDFKKFSFDESSHINQLIDYGHYTQSKKRIQKLFKINNDLSLYKLAINDGFLNIQDSTNSVYKIKVKDYKDNETTITINIEGKHSELNIPYEEKTTPYHILANQPTNLKAGNVSVDFYRNTFYEDFYIDFEVYNDTLKLHDDVLPTKRNFTITFDISKYLDKDKSKLFISRLVGYKKNYPVYSGSKIKGNMISTNTKTLGTYALSVDSTPPTIKFRNFKNGQWISNYRYLKLKIDDKDSGISNYRATVNGKWILMEYDYKTNTLTHDFHDGIVTDVKNNLKVIVTDNVGNSTTFESEFYRK
ncbi:M23 family metallopeptidase [Gaetbulibacter saemankumensis]|uniref:M23 family metallopeptidase n=1 Tax=Gaetbulibacter saemankumensis TaxID=311208 RepID=UPI0003F54452|nr:M23 family metallopeptidase [Gaetbulibacter saemankumensis]